MRINPPSRARRLTHVGALVLALTPLMLGCVAQQATPERVSAPGGSAAQSKQTDLTAAARVSDRILSALIETNGVPGMAAAVWRGDRVVWTGSAGYRDIELKQRVDENTIFRLASVSKVFAVTAAAKLKEDGLLNVDAPVRSIVEYLPDRWPAITTAQLAAHTSGIPHYQAVDEARGGHRFATMREAVAVFQDRDLLFVPQSAYTYSSYGYTLLSAVVEETAKRPYLDYLSQEIVTGLKVGPDVTDTSDPNASKAYQFAEGAIRGAPPHDFSYSWGGAGLAATAPDLARFGGRLMAGKIVSDDTFEWMLVPARLSNGSNVMEKDNTVGFGWRSGQDGTGERTAHHAGVTEGARSTLLLYPDHKLAVSVLSNALWVSAIEQTAIMLAAPFKPTDAKQAVACPTNAVTYEGEYDGKPLAGEARIVLEGGVCTAVISAENAFGEWLNSFPQADAKELQVIGVDPEGGFNRAALVTPVGVYDLKTPGGDGRYTASLGGTRTVSINFRLR